MGAMTIVKLEIQFGGERDTVCLRHPVYRPTCIDDAIPSVRKRANFAHAGWARVVIAMGRKSVAIVPNPHA